VAQPHRIAADVFPTVYRLNTFRDIHRHFGEFEDHSYLYSAEPQYYFGHRYVHYTLTCLRRVLPDVLVSNIFVFLQKRQAAASAPSVV
jgi:hypothetical protein